MQKIFYSKSSVCINLLKPTCKFLWSIYDIERLLNSPLSLKNLILLPPLRISREETRSQKKTVENFSDCAKTWKAERGKTLSWTRHLKKALENNIFGNLYLNIAPFSCKWQYEIKYTPSFLTPQNIILHCFYESIMLLIINPFLLMLMLISIRLHYHTYFGSETLISRLLEEHFNNLWDWTTNFKIFEIFLNWSRTSTGKIEIASQG